MVTFGKLGLSLQIIFESDNATMAEGDDSLLRLRVEIALSAFLSALSEFRDSAENDIRKAEFRDRVAVTLDELNKATYDLLNPNLYRITVRDREGKIYSRERRAASLYLAAQGQNLDSQIVKIERIHPITGKVLGGFYNE